jgi:hypothetical protein
MSHTWYILVYIWYATVTLKCVSYTEDIPVFFVQDQSRILIYTPYGKHTTFAKHMKAIHSGLPYDM